MIKKHFFFLFLLFALAGFSQQIHLSHKAKVSVVTVGPGNELYSTFGHSAFRIKDPKIGLDRVYNYGTFNFNTPNFYVKFTRGKLLYDLSRYPFYYFLKSYQEENRWVKEQVLDLNLDEKQHFFNYLENNAKPENKSYLYDFLAENCATKLPDITEEVLKKNFKLSENYVVEGKTIRNILYDYLEDKPWEKFGIDLALGSIIDKEATAKDYLFLPDYVFEAYKNGTIVKNGNSKPIIKETTTLFEAKPTKKSFGISPIIVFSLLAILVIFITYRDIKNQKRNKWIDFLLFFVNGITGLLIALLWFATDHNATKVNFNVLWAFAPNLIVSFLLLKANLKPWLKNYLKLLLVLFVITAIIWTIGIQSFNLTIVPILLMYCVRYFFLLRNFR